MQGTYIMFLEAGKDIKPEVGKLGTISIKKGLYAYVGSAMGKSVNLENRVNRHKKLAETKKGKKQWHIDYVTTSSGVSVTGVIKIMGKSVECNVADLIKKSGGKIVREKMGSSDCKCKTHFFSINQKVAESFLRQLPVTFG